MVFSLYLSIDESRDDDDIQTILKVVLNSGEL
jgi:hypothetical protein